MRLRTILTTLAALALIALAEESERSHYQSSRYAGDRPVSVDHFKFKEQDLSFNLPAAWAGFYPKEGEELVRLTHRIERDCSITVRQGRLNKEFPDEKEARTFYLEEIAKLQPPNLVHSGRGSEDVTVSNSFPYVCFLNTSNQPTTRIVTFLCAPPYFYSIDLNENPHLLRDHRADYDSLVKSLQTETFASALPAVTSTNLTIESPDGVSTNQPPAAVSTETPAPIPPAVTSTNLPIESPSAESPSGVSTNQPPAVPSP